MAVQRFHNGFTPPLGSVSFTMALFLGLSVGNVFTTTPGLHSSRLCAIEQSLPLSAVLEHLASLIGSDQFSCPF